MFDYMQLEELGDFECISICFSQMPMRPFSDALDTVEKLRQELLHKSTLCRLCGLKDEDFTYGKKLVSNAGVFS